MAQETLNEDVFLVVTALTFCYIMLSLNERDMCHHVVNDMDMTNCLVPCWFVLAPTKDLPNLHGGPFWHQSH